MKIKILLGLIGLSKDRMSPVTQLRNSIDRFRKTLLKVAEIPYNVSLEEVDEIYIKYEHHTRVSEETIYSFIKEIYQTLKHCKTTDTIINLTLDLAYKYLVDTNKFFKNQDMENNKKNRFNISIYLGITLLDSLESYA